jgi:hypothetical protein
VIPTRFVALPLICFASCLMAGDPATPVQTQTLQNVFQLDAKLYSGNAPENEAAFQELARLGVKTIVTVDGSKPNVALAHQFGMHYVHLPFGYDGLPQTRGEELARAVQLAEASGPVYLHCHHGKHRGPTAAAVVCRALDGWSPEQAVDFLHQAGTAADYAGLYRDARAFRPPTAEALAHIGADFPETAKTAPLVDTMVAIDQHCDALKAAQKNEWRNLSGSPESSPAQTATLLWELFREAARDPSVQQLGDDFLSKLATGEKNADALRQSLADPAESMTNRDAAMRAMTQACGDCHKDHRNSKRSSSP